MTRTHSSPSLLPRVLMLATMGLSSHTLAYFRACFSSIPLFFNKVRISHPAIKSESANRALPKWNHKSPQVVGNRIHANNGV